jgi:4-alpha-glucanotransferase
MDRWEECIEALSDKLGILKEFTDYQTQTKYVADRQVKKVLLKALGYPADSLKSAQDSLSRLEADEWRFFIPPVLVLKDGQLGELFGQKGFFLPVVVEQTETHFPLKGVLTLETGESELFDFRLDFKEEASFFLEEKTYFRYKIFIPRQLPLGYHRFSFEFEGQQSPSGRTTQIVMAPSACYVPDSLKDGKTFGVPLQLYAMRSDSNWGIGDFKDLRDFAFLAHQKGAGLVGVNPLSALFLDEPAQASPYYASHRMLLNPLYICVPEVEEFSKSDEAQNLVRSDLFQEKLQKCRESEKVLYEEVADLKNKVLRVLFEEFWRQNTQKDADFSSSERGRRFRTFCEQKKEDLTAYALYQAACLEMGKKEAEKFLASSKKTKDFLKTRKKEILYFEFLQFLAFEQLACVCRELNEKSEGKTGLYMDIAVGTAGQSAEVYGHSDLYMKGVSIGSPPDFFNIRGQDWGLAPINPLRLRQTGFLFMRRLFSEYMSYAKAVRLDHVFSLERLFLQSPNKKGGAYLKYPFYELSGILALESHRHQCLVIGEDLGTSPEGFFDKMQAQNIFCFRIFRYEKRFDTYLTPFEYEKNCVVVTGTHDMSPFPSFWRGTDLKFLEKFAGWNEEKIRFESDERATERKEIILALAKQGIFFADTVQEDFPVLQGKELPAQTVPAVYRFLSDSNSKILLVQLEDVFGQEYQMNIPGTTSEYPNWRYKLEIKLEDFQKQPSFEKVFQSVHEKR